MKICHVITRLILGGAQENTLLTCEGLHRRGHDVTLITGPAIGPEGQLMTRARAGGYRVIELNQMRRQIDPRLDWLSYKKLKELFAELRPDVMHSHSSKAGIVARRAAAKVGGMKIVHTIHGLAYHKYQNWAANRFYVELEKRAAARTDAIISVCDAMTRQALAAGVGQPEKYVTIYSGMEVADYAGRTDAADEFRASLHLPTGAILVTQVSRLAELKGHEYIIAAAKIISDKRVCFCFVGDGALSGEIKKQIAAAELEERFRLTGLLPPEKIPAVMHASDVVVHCSLREGLARAIPQAMLAGRPVVSFDIDGAAEVVNDSTGALVAPKDIPSLAVSIDRLVQSPSLRAELGQNAREKCLKMFDHNLMVDQIQALYERLLAGGVANAGV